MIRFIMMRFIMIWFPGRRACRSKLAQGKRCVNSSTLCPAASVPSLPVRYLGTSYVRGLHLAGRPSVLRSLTARLPAELHTVAGCCRHLPPPSRSAIQPLRNKVASFLAPELRSKGRKRAGWGANETCLPSCHQRLVAAEELGAVFAIHHAGYFDHVRQDLPRPPPCERELHGWLAERSRSA
jgi:hypothetical protein